MRTAPFMKRVSARVQVTHAQVKHAQVTRAQVAQVTHAQLCTAAMLGCFSPSTFE
jgi:hypothetical protein